MIWKNYSSNMLVKDILQKKVSLIRHVIDQPNSNIIAPQTLYNILYKLSPAIKDKQDIARNLLKTNGEEVYKQYKKNNMPVWFPCGILKDGSSYDKDVIEYSNILAIDIDDIEGEELEKFRTEFFKEDFVFAVLESLSGIGLYALILVEDGQNTREYYKYIGLHIEEKYNIEIDKHCKNIARKRFISYDENMNMWIKSPDTEITPWTFYLDERTEDLFNFTPKPKNSTSIFKNRNQFEVQRTHDAILAVLDTGFTTDDYGHWYYLARDFAAFPDGEYMYAKLCNNYSGEQDRNAVKNTWKHCMQEPSIIDDNMHRRWQGLAKKLLGAKWWNK